MGFDSSRRTRNRTGLALCWIKSLALTSLPFLSLWPKNLVSYRLWGGTILQSQEGRGVLHRGHLPTFGPTITPGKNTEWPGLEDMLPMGLGWWLYSEAPQDKGWQFRRLRGGISRRRGKEAGANIHHYHLLTLWLAQMNEFLYAN